MGRNLPTFGQIPHRHDSHRGAFDELDPSRHLKESALAGKKGMCIVLIECSRPDERWLRILLDELRFEYQLLHYATGVAALKAAHNWEDVDLVVVGLPLQALDPPDTMQGIRQWCDCPILLIGSTATAEAQRHAVRWYFNKPIDIMELGGVISEIDHP
jgi:hypothetical protein